MTALLPDLIGIVVALGFFAAFSSPQQQHPGGQENDGGQEHKPRHEIAG